MVQKKVIARVVELLKKENAAPTRLLDVGAGTGMLVRTLRGMFTNATAIGIDLAIGMSRTARRNMKKDTSSHILTADAEFLPFRNEVFDLVISTSTFQWLMNLDEAFNEARRVLLPGGLFIFTLFGENTLFELRSSFREALASYGGRNLDPTHKFFSRKEVLSALDRSGFKELRVLMENEVEYHIDVPSLLRSLKRIGAGNASELNPSGLSGRGVMVDMMSRYQSRFLTVSGIPATYEIIYGIVRKDT
jgi:malonyl-CoA O-methyltransferase